MNQIQVPGCNPNIPKQLVPFVTRCPRLLPGESEENYHALFDLMVEDIDPVSVTEWLVLVDIVGLFWDISRYRGWKDAILTTYRRSSLEAALRDTHRSHAVMGDVPAIVNIARREAEDWRTDPAKRKVLDARLAEHGYDEEAINAGTLLQGLEALATIDRFLSSARSQLNAMLKGISVRRKFVDRASKALRERVLHAKSQPPKPKQIDTH